MSSKAIKSQSLSIILLVVLCGCIAKNETAPVVVPTAKNETELVVVPTATSVPATVIPSAIFTSTFVLPQSPLPFSYVEEMPNGKFLYIHIEDYYNHCVEGLCDCSPFIGEGEPPVSPIWEEDSKFTLNSNFLPSSATEWLQLRKETHLIALYTIYSPQNADLRYYSAFPFKTPKGGFSIVGVNSDGDIQAKVQDGYVIIPAGSDYTAEQLEIIDSKCTYLHDYALFNYGFISDDDIVIEDHYNKP